MSTAISNSDLSVQFLGRAHSGELLVVIGHGAEVTPDSEIHHKTPSEGDWMFWGSIRDLQAWRPPVSTKPRADGSRLLDIQQDPELPAYDPTTKIWLLQGAQVSPMNADAHTWRFGEYPLGEMGTLKILEWDRH